MSHDTPASPGLPDETPAARALSEKEKAVRGLEVFIELLHELAANLEAQAMAPPPPPTWMARLRRLLTGEALAQKVRRTACGMLRRKIERLATVVRAEVMADIDANAAEHALDDSVLDCSTVTGSAESEFLEASTDEGRDPRTTCLPRAGVQPAAALLEGACAAQACSRATGELAAEAERVACLASGTAAGAAVLFHEIAAPAPAVEPHWETAMAHPGTPGAGAEPHDSQSGSLPCGLPHRAVERAGNTGPARRLARDDRRRISLPGRGSGPAAPDAPKRRANWREARGPDFSVPRCFSRYGRPWVKCVHYVAIS